MIGKYINAQKSLRSQIEKQESYALKKFRGFQNFQACTYSTVVGAVTITWSYLRSSTVRKFTPYILYILRAPHQARRCEKQGWKQRNILGTISPICSNFFGNSIQGGIAK